METNENYIQEYYNKLQELRKVGSLDDLIGLICMYNYNDIKGKRNAARCIVFDYNVEIEDSFPHCLEVLICVKPIDPTSMSEDDADHASWGVNPSDLCF